MSKRISNRKGKGGARSRRTWRVHMARRVGRPATVPVAPVSAPARIPGPTRRGMLSRIVAPVKNFLRRVTPSVVLVTVLVACSSGGGRQAIADVTDAMFDALVARVTTNENAILALQNAPGTPNVVDVNGTVVGPVLGRGNGGTAIVEVTINGLPYVATFGPGGTWKPKVTYHSDPLCRGSIYVDQREVENGFGFVWSPDLTDTVQAGFFDLVDVGSAIVPGWRKDGTGFCEAIQNPRIKLYNATFIGSSDDLLIAPFSIAR